VVSAAKLVQFLHLDGIAFTFPFVTLLVCVLGGIIAVFLTQLGLNCWRTPVSLAYFRFFNTFCIGFAFSACLLMGLYFREVACLTSEKKIRGLDLYFWPAVAVIGASWVLILISGGVSQVVSLQVTTALLVNFAFMIAALVVQLFVCAFGSVSLFFMVRKSGGSSSADVVRLICLTLGASIVLTGFGIGYLVLQNFKGTYPLSNTMTTISFVVFQEFAFVFVPCCCMLMVAINFRVAVSKEIELSKSGTSSTSSSGRSSSSSSSSSSKSVDPVIEL